MDVDDDGELTLFELNKLAQALTTSSVTVHSQHVLKEMDTGEKDDKVTFDEFVEW